MATKSVSIPEQTEEAKFGEIPSESKFLFTVLSGVSSGAALGQADSIDESVRDLLLHAVAASSGLSPEAAFLCEFAMDAAKALRTSVGARG